MLEHVPSLFSHSLLLKLTIVAWLALMVRMVIRQQRGPLLILAGLCVVLSGAAAATGAHLVPHGCSAAVAIALAFLCFLTGPERRTMIVMAVAAGVGAALSAGAFYRSVPAEQPVAAWALLAGNCIVAAIALTYALEMTLFLSPLEMRAEPSAKLVVNRLSVGCGAALVLSALAVATVFLGSGPVSSVDGGRMRDEFQIIAWLFAATVLLVQFVVLLGLRRTLRNSLSGVSTASSTEPSVKASQKASQEWGSLTISVWIALVALVVSLAVPMNWPWEVNAPADALIGELLE